MKSDVKVDNYAQEKNDLARFLDGRKTGNL